MVSMRAWTVVFVLPAALSACAPSVQGQGAPARPPKRSFSNAPKTPARAPASGKLRQATQEELTEAVLGDTMTLLWSKADEHAHIGEYNHFINLSKIVVQGDPHNMEAYATSAWLLWSTSRADAAEAVLKEGIAANPNTFYLYDEMGMYWFIQRKNPAAAIPYYEKAVKFDCPFLTWNSLANCYERTGQWENAVGAWQKASVYPADAIARVRLKRAQARLAQIKGTK